MGLGRCRDCGKEVAPNAKTCPYCGAPVWVASCLMNIIKVILIVVLALGFWLFQPLLREIYLMLRAWMLGTE
jgi:hypothetical protein